MTPGSVTQDAQVDPNLIDVELYGIVYIYNPVNKAQLSVDAPAEGAALPADGTVPPADGAAPPADGAAPPAEGAEPPPAEAAAAAAAEEPATPAGAQ